MCYNFNLTTILLWIFYFIIIFKAEASNIFLYPPITDNIMKKTTSTTCNGLIFLCKFGPAGLISFFSILMEKSKSFYND